MGRGALLPLPSWPLTLLPHASAWPSLASASVWKQPIRAEVTVTPGGSWTLTGTALLVLVPSPSSPPSLAPHARRTPAVAGPRTIAMPVKVVGPAPMATPVTPARSFTRTGESRSVAVPSPSSATLLAPRLSTWPGLVSAKLWAMPPVIAVTVVPVGSLTWTGLLMLLGRKAPVPSCPSTLSPQASSLPVLVSARTWPPPPNRLRTVVPDGSAALTGVLLSLLVEPLPSSPNPL